MKYQTKQRQIVLEYLKQHDQEHYTVDEIEYYLKQHHMPVSRTTIYRYLEELTRENLVKKYFIENGTPICYQYVHLEMRTYHLLCNHCGKLVHITCQHLTDVLQHLENEHHFELDTQKITFYGRCEQCMKEGKE